MTEENPETLPPSQARELPPVTEPEGETSPNDGLINNAYKLAERLENIYKKNLELLDRQENFYAKQLLAGKSILGVKEKEKTPQEIAEEQAAEVIKRFF